MKIALIPLLMTSEDPGAALRAMARSVEKFHSSADLIVFPQIEIFGPAHLANPPRQDAVSHLHLQSDIAAAFAKKRNVYIAAGFWETRESDHYAMLVLADPTGQVAVRTRKLAAESASGKPGLSLLAARVGSLRAGVCLSDDLFDRFLMDAVTPLALRLLAVPVYLTAPRDDAAKAEDTLSAVEELRGQLGRVARQSRAYVMAVNSLSDEPGLGSCGGAWVYGPSGQVMTERALYDDTPLEFEIS